MRLTYGALDLTDYPYSIEFGLDTGAPQNVSEALAFLLQDGEVVLSSRASNRTMQFNVLIEGPDLAATADAEAALIAETEKPKNTIDLDPEDFGPVTVYETYRGQVSLLRDDAMETAKLRRFTVTVSALPFPRSATETITAALAASGTTTTLVNDGSSTTGWSGTVNGLAASPSVVSGALKVSSGSAITGTVTVIATLIASIATSLTPWIVVDWKPESTTGNPDITAFGDGFPLRKDGQIGLPSGLTRTWFHVTVPTLGKLSFASSSTPPSGGVINPGAAVRSLYVDNINRTDVKPAIGTNRQLQRTVAVGGTARTPGNLVIEHASSSLGDVLAYVWATDPKAPAYSPPMRQYRVSGGTVTSDSTLVSGSRDPITTGTVYDVPLNATPVGSAILVVRAKVFIDTAGSARLNWSSQTRVNSTAVGSAVSGSCTLPDTATAYNIVAVGKIPQPTWDVSQASTGVQRLTLSTTLAGINTAVTIDEAWLFSNIGQLVGASCGTGTAASGGPANRLFINAPTIDIPRPVVRVGFAADGSDAFHPSNLFAWQLPQLLPPEVNLLTVTTNALDASGTLRNFDRFHTNATH